MSQKSRDFQSKPKRSGQKFNSRPPSGGRDRRPAGGQFRDKNEGDRSDRPARSFDRPAGSESGFARRERPAGDAPYKKKPFDRDSRPPSKGSGDRKPFNKEKRFDRDRPTEDRPARSFDRPKRDYSRDKDQGDKSSRAPASGKPWEKKPYKKREFGGGDSKPAFNKEKRFDRHDNRPQKSYERYDRPAGADAHKKLKSERPAYGAPSSAYLFGIHAVSQALLNPERAHKRLLCTEKGFQSLQDAWQEASTEGITLPEVITVEKEDIDRLLPRDAVHQDVLLDCKPLEETSLYEFLLTVPEEAKVLVLDQVTDPHNVGAILRSAAAFGANAVVLQTLHAPEVTGTLAKSASGALEHVPLVREVNLSRALEQLKEAGFFCIGLAEGGKQTLSQLKLTGKTALVLGAEGTGLRRLVAENCDALVKLPTQPPIGSLNVSNAAAIALYELARE